MREKSRTTRALRTVRETLGAIAFFGLVLVVATSVTAGVTLLGAPLAADPPLAMKTLDQVIEDGATP